MKPHPLVGLSDYLLGDYLAVELSIDGGWTLLILESLVDLALCETSYTAICASHHHGIVEPIGTEQNFPPYIFVNIYFFSGKKPHG